MPSRRALLAIAAVILAALLVGYFTGTFDRALYGVGLNFKECAHNALGVTFCGSELDQEREALYQQRQQAKEREERTHELAEARERKREEEQARIQAEGRAARRHGEEEQAALRHSTEESNRRLAEQGREAQETIKQSAEQGSG